MSTPSAHPESSSVAAARSESFGRWMALLAALLGWMFDGAEMGLFSLVGQPAIQDLLGYGESPTTAEKDKVSLWFGIVIAIFLVGAATGGVVFGWLGDRLGRVRAMSLSVLTYALFTGLCGLAQSPVQVAALRFIASLGMGGEWALGVSLVMEVWPNRSRAFMAGLIGAAANVGYMLVGFLGLVLHGLLAETATLLRSLHFSEEMVHSLVAFGGWRLLMLCGALPALLTFFVRMCVPESQKWESQRAGGGTKNWAAADLVGVLVGAVGPALIIWLWATENELSVRIVGTVFGLAVATAGYLYPVLGYLGRQAVEAKSRIVPSSRDNTLPRMLLGAGLSGVALLGTWGSIQWAPAWAGTVENARASAAQKVRDSRLAAGEVPSAAELAAAEKQPTKEWTQIVQAFGAVVGTILAAFCGDWLGRRWTYAAMCVLSFATILLLYLGAPAFDASFLGRVFLGGVCTAAFYGWLPLYLPELFRTSVRATAQGFAFNFGRILAAVGALQTGVLFKQTLLIGNWTLAGHPLACSCMSLIYILGLVLIFFAPETKGQPLPD